MEHSAYCGLCCDHCIQRVKIRPDAQALQHSMQRAGYERFGTQIEGFAAFWAFLSKLSEGGGCAGCREGGGNPLCNMRACAKQRGVDRCALCENYPCAEFDRAFPAYPMLREDNRLLREEGEESWLVMQARRKEEGYCYCDAVDAQED